MASNINSNNINGAYPIPGQDNDSQGFRDNFTNIKNNLASAKSEIEDLQSKAVLKSALYGSSTTANDFGGTIMTGGVLAGFTESTYFYPEPPPDPAAAPQGVEMSFALGTNQYLITNTSVSLTFLDWPSITNLSTQYNYARMRLLLNVIHTGCTLTFPVPSGTGAGTIMIGVNKVPGMIFVEDPVTHLPTTVPTNVAALSVGFYLFEFSTFDGGASVIVQTLVSP